VVEIESPIIGPSRVYEASGHVENFTDPIVECTRCGRKFRADHLIEEKLGVNAEGLSVEEMTRLIREHGITCPVCGGELGEVRLFNLLFKTQIGPYEGNIGYIRPELAQGMFVAFRRVFDSMRGRLPLGIAQIGRVGRNEISPRQGMVRLREFTIAEMEYFMDPEDEEGSCPWFSRAAGVRVRILSCSDKREGREPREVTLGEAVESGLIIHRCLAYWMGVAQEFVESLGIPPEDVMFEEKCPEERAHYSSQTFDQLVRASRWGWVEVSGHSYRGDFDLSRHMRYSGQDLTVFKPYPRPVVVKRKKVLVNKAVVGRLFRSEAPKVIAALQALDPEEVEARVGRGEPVRAGGYEVPPEAVRVVEVEEKVSGRKIVPHVVEPSFGVERLLYVALEHAYREVEGRVVLSLPRDIAPIQAVVLPLVENDEELVERARRIYESLKAEGFRVYLDASGSIGRRYARADEIGVPAAVTVDYQTLEDGTVTLRDRDTWRQVRVPEGELADRLRRFIYNAAKLEDLGTPVGT
ncbi:MAG: glycine--tRNA ligase, partial [Desulfurococcales archaeon]|nr:glycine--tRNA ligase [Desulfurococcales archaeon]